MKKAWDRLWAKLFGQLDNDSIERYLDRKEKHSLLSDGILIGAILVTLFTIGVIAGILWAAYEEQQEEDKIIKAFATYLATATSAEYEEIAQSIRHDLVYSEYGQDVAYLIEYLPNTAETCCLERNFFLERINVVFLNTGEAYGLDVYQR